MDFMRYLDSNQISSVKFRDYSSQAILNKQIVSGKTTDLNYILLEGDALVSFKDLYVSDMQNLAKNPNFGLIIDAYINKK